ncbi:ribonuclease H family protein [uncultured Thomasclavelia sp.]|uniref:ribonuclease H family protein n=1 Tax=uncultured Thomasclavelia sp. TaxID=3025759 RepID=UPI0025FB0C63|nr:ribonuclease H family protein [uncultured Thomasclavelia sp.]
MAKYYAVKKGRKPGIYNSWDLCQQQVNGFKGAIFKSFKTEAEALAFIEDKPLEKSYVDVDVDLQAYVDGSFNTTTREYGYGCVIIKDQQVVKEFFGKGNNEELTEMRNVAGEILACLNALKYAIAHGYKSIGIYYDFEGIENWATSAWQATKPGTIAYQNKMKELRQQIAITFVKVEAHSGDFYNDRADKLAKKAVGIKA